MKSLESTTYVHSGVSLALILVQGGVVAHFIGRYARMRKLPSISVAILALGWVLLAARDLALIPPEVILPMLCLGLINAVLLLLSTWRLDHSEERR